MELPKGWGLSQNYAQDSEVLQRHVFFLLASFGIDSEVRFWLVHDKLSSDEHFAAGTSVLALWDCNLQR